MAKWYQRITEALVSLNQEYRSWQTGDGELLLTRHAARVLACHIPGVQGNLFWHNTAVENPATASAALMGGGGLGGDRLWIAPERNYMWEDLVRAGQDPKSSHHVPVSMDPGHYFLLDDADDQFYLESQVALRDHRVDGDIRVRLGRRFHTVSRPENIAAGLKVVSFGITNEMFLIDAQPGVMAGMWDLLQVPPRGWIVCPTVSPVASPRSYYNPFGPQHVVCTPHAVLFRVDAERRIKMGLGPQQTTGRMGYYRVTPEASTLIVRIFNSAPGETYIDLPLDSEETLGGDALQCYNDDGGPGSFGELEYHDPAILAGRGPMSRTGTCVTHVLAGEDADIRGAANELLGVDLPPAVA